MLDDDDVRLSKNSEEICSVGRSEKMNLALKAFLKSRTNAAMAIYKGLQNQVTKVLLTAKATYYITIIIAVADQLSVHLEAITRWLNSQKKLFVCFCVCFCVEDGPHQPHYDNHVKINNQHIEQVSEVKYLCLLFNI